MRRVVHAEAYPEAPTHPRPSLGTGHVAHLMPSLCYRRTIGVCARVPGHKSKLHASHTPCAACGLQERHTPMRWHG